MSQPGPFEETPPHAGRHEVLAIQQRNLRRLLTYVWHCSPFYRRFYADHGLCERDLGEVGIRDLPPTSKDVLMAHFDCVVTDEQLRLADLQAWIERDTPPASLFARKFIVLHTSGSSGRMGIFVYDRAAWRRILARMNLPHFDDGADARVVYYGAVHSRFAGAIMCACVLGTRYALSLLSVLEPHTRNARQLNEMRPKMLIGYASSITTLADLALTGALDIHPKIVVVSGDPFTAEMRRRVESAWDVPVVNLYSASESLMIAISPPGAAEMCVLDDLQIAEVLDEAGREVAAHETGRLTLTNLYNLSLPLIRYKMDDFVTKGALAGSPPFGTITDICGREHEMLPVRLADGAVDDINPIMLTGCGGFDIPGLERLQFVSRAPERVDILYAGIDSLEARIGESFRALLAAKGAAQTVTFTVSRVDALAPDSGTGKVPLVRMAPRV
ncbi:MAG: phenylacetate--CoA ligase family protein [Gammaproteobacteria bacterium]|nr:phenylacetate--CoA ligase family protein [Gammaproteobacteria bacterium]NIR81722.1 phenylacetate--CoA ligase family protein [Gammaproteobacteria bacterium]NIR88525.1 phenylacetate--CoA ligase family protein [Gammaproteobacteria bacterium]